MQATGGSARSYTATNKARFRGLFFSGLAAPEDPPNFRWLGNGAPFEVPRGITGYRSKATYIVRHVLGQALATGIAVQLKHVINGEDPENMETLPFAKKLASGAVIAPLISSLVFGSQGEHAALGIPFGPAGDALQQLESLVMRGRDELNGKPPGEKDHFDAEKYSAQWLAFVRSNAVPFANVWYVKSAFNHAIYQQLQELVSPGYNERVQRRLERENRNTWWNPGDTTPDRAPDVGAAVGQPTQ